MKHVYIYVTGFFLCIAVFSILFGIHSNNIQKREHEKRLLQNQKAKQVDTTDAIRLTPETIYILETYQASEDRVSKKTKTLPAMMAGKNRNELEQLIQDYVTNPPLKESLNGLTDMEIISFAKEKLIVRKTYQDLAKENRFYLTFRKDEVVVYYNDKKTIFQYTGIVKDSLLQEECDKLQIGYYVKDEEQLYGILECYSS